MTSAPPCSYVELWHGSQQLSEKSVVSVYSLGRTRKYSSILSGSTAYRRIYIQMPYIPKSAKPKILRSTVIHEDNFWIVVRRIMTDRHNQVNGTSDMISREKSLAMFGEYLR